MEVVLKSHDPMPAASALYISYNPFNLFFGSKFVLWFYFGELIHKASVAIIPIISFNYHFPFKLC